MHLRPMGVPKAAAAPPATTLLALHCIGSQRWCQKGWCQKGSVKRPCDPAASGHLTASLLMRRRRHWRAPWAKRSGSGSSGSYNCRVA